MPVCAAYDDREGARPAHPLRGEHARRLVEREPAVLLGRVDHEQPRVAGLAHEGGRDAGLVLLEPAADRRRPPSSTNWSAVSAICRCSSVKSSGVKTSSVFAAGDEVLRALEESSLSWSPPVRSDALRRERSLAWDAAPRRALSRRERRARPERGARARGLAGRPEPAPFLAAPADAWHAPAVPSRGQVLARRALLRNRVRTGDAPAALALARSLDGETPRNHAAARRAYRVAAEAGLGEAQAALGAILRDGRGGERDLAAAARWFAEGARRGSADAMAGLAAALLHGDGVRLDRPGAVRLLRRAASAGHVAAMVELAGCLERGQGAPRDEAAALRWLRRAAERGDAAAARRVGLAYWSGKQGVARDRARAAPYLLAAARRGDAAAMYRVALARRDGDGLARSATSAGAWARRAAAAGSARARALLARGSAAARPGPRRARAERLRRRAGPRRAPAAARAGSARPCRRPPPRTRTAASRP